jgi:hypothetical protein
VPLALGALAKLREWEALLAREGDPGERTPADLVHAALGLLSLSRTLERWVTVAAGDARPREAAGARGAARSSELLR